MTRPLGVVDVAYRAVGDVPSRVSAAIADGFDHIDVALDEVHRVEGLAVGCPTAFPKPVDTWCATPAPSADVPGAWDRAVRWWRAAPHALCEPWAGSVVGTLDAMRAFREAVPGVRFLIDTGHVASWGGDPCEVLDWADHVQCRQGGPGVAQLRHDDPAGTVDFGSVFRHLDARGYRGRVSVEYFDLPELGWPCPDPRAWACDLAAWLRAQDWWG